MWLHYYYYDNIIFVSRFIISIQSTVPDRCSVGNTDETPHGVYWIGPFNCKYFANYNITTLYCLYGLFSISIVFMLVDNNLTNFIFPTSIVHLCAHYLSSNTFMFRVYNTRSSIIHQHVLSNNLYLVFKYEKYVGSVRVVFNGVLLNEKWSNNAYVSFSCSLNSAVTELLF